MQYRSELAAPRRATPRREPAPEPNGRVVQVDILKALLIAWIIGCHALLGYAPIGGWPYDEVNEVTMGRRTELILAVVLGPTALVVIGTFFFLAGLFASREAARHGLGHFATQRVLRLGLPWLAFVVAIWPFFMWIAYRSAGDRISLWQAFLERQPFLDSGPLWFVQILMYVSLGYAAWLAVRPRRGSTAKHGARTPGALLVGTIVAIAAASFVVRLWFPARSQQVFDLHVWQWPQCVGMFVLGVVVSGRGWLTRVPPRIARLCAAIVGGTVLVIPLIAVFARVTDVTTQGVPFLGGWHWQAALLDAVEGVLVVAGSVGLLALAQRRLPAQSTLLRRWGQASYLAYMLQVPVLIGLSVALRPVPWPAVAKAGVVALLAVWLCFAVASLIKRRTPLGRWL